MRALVALALVLTLTGCNLGASSSVPATCTTAGDRCALEGGVLGVCTVNEAGRCERPPCLVCTPQH